jgi:hypothetical protein
MKNLFDRLKESAKRDLELYAVDYPATVEELTRSLKKNKYFVSMRWGDVENLCSKCTVRSPYDLLNEDE